MAEKYELQLREGKGKQFATKIRSYDPGNAQETTLLELEKKLCFWTTGVLKKHFKISPKTKEDIGKSIPILIFCFLTSRIGEDINEALDEDTTKGIDEDVLIKRCDQSSTDEIENYIINRLQRYAHNKGFQLIERVWDQALDEGQKRVIVFCVISSRIGTDIDNAMRGVHGNDRVILVLLHCVLPSLLRGNLSDDEELLDPTMRNRMSGIAHFAFSDREGLYDCQQNRLGFKRLVDLCASTQ